MREGRPRDKYQDRDLVTERWGIQPGSINLVEGCAFSAHSVSKHFRAGDRQPNHGPARTKRVAYVSLFLDAMAREAVKVCQQFLQM